MNNTSEKAKGLEIIRFVQQIFHISDDELIKEITKNRPATVQKQQKKPTIKFTEEQFENFILQDGCTLCGSQRCLGDLKSAKNCRRFLDWLKTGKMS